MEQSNQQIVFTRQDSNVFKGLAIFLMLVHHLFYVRNGSYDDILFFKNCYLVNQIAILSKICVVFFCFLSGYGLAVQAEKKNGIVGNLKDFYLHRFKKLYLNYWFIWVIFVPISYFCFGITFTNVYHNQIGWHLIADLLGIHYLVFGTYGYNPTWWFYSCIILLYLLFPVIYKMIKREPLLLLLSTLIISYLPIPFIDVIQFNIFAFALGIWAVGKTLINRNKWFAFIVLLFFCILRNINSYPYLIDCIIVLVLTFAYKMTHTPKSITNAFAFLGHHSMNIFLFHTFIYSMWFHSFIYASRNPIVITLLLFAICIPISIILEFIKKYTIYKLL